MTITLTVSGRIASVDATTHVVAGNTYPVTLTLDSEWTGNLYLRVRFGSLYYDIPFASSAASVDVQMPVGYPEVGIGVYSEALEICTCEARVRLLRSILEAGEQVVEFDSDLYDQWAGEVTTLLTDDAFDAESTRPVQNAVLTAWKDTVPLDSALVHKTGNESIGGQKTFTARMFVREPSIPSIHVVSETAYTATGWKGLIGFFDQKDGSSNEAVGIYTSVASGEVNLGLRVHKPNRSGQFDTILRSYDDHQLIITTPYYPVDGGGNPQPLAANALMASGNIAVDPRLVHTTGNETVAGAKTFTSLLTASNVQVKDASTPTVTMLKGSTEVASLASDGTQAGLTASSQFFGLRGLGTTPFGQAPSYTADNSADAKIVTRAMLATTPTVVHTTGNEAVAGVKTFTGTVACGNVGRRGFVYPTDASIRIEIARIPANVADFYAEVTVQNTYNDKVVAILFLGSAPTANARLVQNVSGVGITIGICVDPTTSQRIIWFKSPFRNNHLASVQAYSRLGDAISMTMLAQFSTYTPDSEPTVEAYVTAGGN